MDPVSLTLILVGAYAGRTIVLNSHEFVNGECTLTGEATALSGALNYLNKCYGVYVKGSAEAKKAQENWDAIHGSKETKNGQCDTDTGDQPDPPAEIQREVQPDGPRTASEAPIDSTSDVDADTGSAGGVSSGDGHEDAGIFSRATAEVGTRIADAIQTLDPLNDDHWTQADGKPAVSAVSEAAGMNVTRPQIEAVAKDWNRETALEAKTKPS